jgi:hypothetical protein
MGCGRGLRGRSRFFRSTCTKCGIAVKQLPIFATFSTGFFQSIKKVGVIKINKLAIFTGKICTLFLLKLKNFPRFLTWGRIGSAGTVRKTWFATEAEALKAEQKLIDTIKPIIAMCRIGFFLNSDFLNEETLITFNFL